MPLDHSALLEPVSIRRETIGSDGPDNASVVTPPVWAQSVDLKCELGAVRVATTGTEGTALTHYFEVATGQAYNLKLQTPAQNRAAVSYLLSVGDTGHTVSFAYNPREA